MSEKELTFERVDELVRTADLPALERVEARRFTTQALKASPGEVASEICQIYGVVRPILNLVKNILPEKWRQVIETFIRVMDTLCGLAG